MTLFSHVFLIEREVLTLLILGFGCLHETSLGLQNIYLVASYLAIKFLYVDLSFYSSSSAHTNSQHPSFPPTQPRLYLD